jgi:hypothetical protein
VTVSTRNAALVASLDPVDQTRTGRVYAARDCRIVAATAADPGVFISTANVNRWNDYRGSTIGAPNLLCGAGTNTNGPTLTGIAGSGNEYVTFNGTTQWLQNASADVAYALDGVGTLNYILIARVSGNGGMGGIGRDSTALTVPYMGASVVGGTHRVDFNPAAGAIQVDSTVASGPIRLHIVTKYALRNTVAAMNGVSSGDLMVGTKLGGRLAPTSRHNTLMTAGNNFEFIGRLGATFCPMDVFWEGYVKGDLSQANIATLEAWAFNEFGAVHDTSKRTAFYYGASLTEGALNNGTYVATPTPEGMVAIVSGARGSLAAQGFDTVGRAVNKGVSGRTLAQATLCYDLEIGPSINTARPGPNVMIVSDLASNSFGSGGVNDTQAWTDLTALCQKHFDAGGRTIVKTIPDRDLWYTGGVALNPATGISTQGGYALAYNQRLRGQYFLLPGCIGLIDWAGDNNFLLDRNNPAFGIESCQLDGVHGGAGTFYDSANGGGVHFAQPGYTYTGAMDKTALDANDTWLYPLAAAAASVGGTGNAGGRGNVLLDLFLMQQKEKAKRARNLNRKD